MLPVPVECRTEPERYPDGTCGCDLAHLQAVLCEARVVAGQLDLSSKARRRSGVDGVVDGLVDGVVDRVRGLDAELADVRCHPHRTNWQEQPFLFLEQSR